MGRRGNLVYELPSGAPGRTPPAAPSSYRSASARRPPKDIRVILLTVLHSGEVFNRQAPKDAKRLARMTTKKGRKIHHHEVTKSRSHEVTKSRRARRKNITAMADDGFRWLRGGGFLTRQNLSILYIMSKK